MAPTPAFLNLSTVDILDKIIHLFVLFLIFFCIDF